jgi:hypothetical protein
MAIFLGNNDRVEVSFICRWNDQIGVNVRRFRLEMAPSVQVSLSDLASAVSTAYGVVYVDVLAGDAEYRGAGVRRILTLATPTEWSSSGSGQGTGPSTVAPPQTAGLISLRSDFPGRQGRGRAYLPFPDKAHVSATAGISAAYLAAAGDLGTTFIRLPLGDILPVSVTLVGIARFDVGAILVPWTSRIIRSGWATQRRRSYFGARNIPPI